MTSASQLHRKSCACLSLHRPASLAQRSPASAASLEQPHHQHRTRARPKAQHTVTHCDLFCLWCFHSKLLVLRPLDPAHVLRGLHAVLPRRLHVFTGGPSRPTPMATAAHHDGLFHHTSPQGSPQSARILFRLVLMRRGVESAAAVRIPLRLFADRGVSSYSVIPWVA